MTPRFTIPGFRWFIAALLLAVTLINYTDRLTISVLVKNILEDLHLNEADYSQIISLFLVAYAVMYAGSGYVVDLLGTRMGMAFFVCAWSIFQMLHALAAGKWSLALCRFGLGLAEPGSFPAATKAVGEWFPPGQRALGVGIFNAGSSLGAAVAAPLAAFIGLRFGWRTAFVITGALGLVWVVVWLLLYDTPKRNRCLDQKEPASFSPSGFGPGFSAPDPRPQTPRPRPLAVLTSRAGFMLVVARFLTDPVIYFVSFWLPAYLEKERGFDLAMIGRYAWLPYAFGGVGYLAGGWLSGRTMRAGWSLGKSRKAAMTVGAMLMPAAILAPLVPFSWMAIALMCVIVLGHAIWVANLMTLPADLFPPGQVATAAGFSGMGGAIAGAVANLGIGWVVMHFSYLPIFICAGLLHPTAIALLWRFLPERLFPKMP